MICSKCGTKSPDNVGYCTKCGEHFAKPRNNPRKADPTVSRKYKLIAAAVARELNVPLTRTLKKIRNTPPQSGIPNAARRRANVLNAYRAVNNKEWAGKRILLLDDIITTGATASECAKTLLIAGAKEVSCAAVAVAAYEKDRK